MEKVILARIGEIALKGLNRSVFEQRMARNMRAALSDCGACHIRWSQSRYYVEPETENFDFETALERLSGVFGLVSVSPAYATRSNTPTFRRLQRRSSAIYSPAEAKRARLILHLKSKRNAA